MDDVTRIPTTVKQELRDSESAHPPFGDYRFTSPAECVRVGSTTGTTGTPTLTLWTRRDLWIEYESAARVWWRYDWRPGQIVTHAHPGYLYGGGVMLSGCLEYFGMLNLWVPPPETDEIAEQALRTWQRIRPDVSMVAFDHGRFAEVADRLGLSISDDCGLPPLPAARHGAQGPADHDVWCRGVCLCGRAVHGGRGRARGLRPELGEEAAPLRGAVREFLAGVVGLEADEQRRALADAGYLVPHWPAPWGRDASPTEQLVVEEELHAARIRRPHLAVGAWALPTVIAYGTDEQQERWIPPTLRGEIAWCQLFSEPGAGSDLAALATRAVPTDGGWSLSGQKVWTSMAREADWGICLVRTDPHAPKHAGITCFLVDMRSGGIEIRPLRELTGTAMFNEVFLDDVFVPDDCVIGEVGAGWAAARTTLAHERVAMGTGSSLRGADPVNRRSLLRIPKRTEPRIVSFRWTIRGSGQ